MGPEALLAVTQQSLLFAAVSVGETYLSRQVRGYHQSHDPFPFILLMLRKSCWGFSSCHCSMYAKAVIAVCRAGCAGASWGQSRAAWLGVHRRRGWRYCRGDCPVQYPLAIFAQRTHVCSSCRLRSCGRESLVHRSRSVIMVSGCDAGLRPGGGAGAGGGAAAAGGLGAGYRRHRRPPCAQRQALCGHPRRPIRCWAASPPQHSHTQSPPTQSHL